MGWRDWPYWLKGGVIGLIILIPGALFIFTSIGGLILLLLFPILLLLNPIGDYIYQTYRVADVSPTGFVMYSLPNKFMLIKYIIYFLGVIIYVFLLGALIGWIYGKIKNRK